MTPHTHAARPRARYLLIAAMCAVAATACGSKAAPASPAPAAKPKVSLDINVTGGAGGPKHWTLRCDPPGGTHPDPAAACDVLFRAKDPFAPVQRGIRCPLVIAGTKVAKVRGIYFGQHVDTTFTQGGCQLPRWAKIGQIFN